MPASLGTPALCHLHGLSGRLVGFIYSRVYALQGSQAGYLFRDSGNYGRESNSPQIQLSRL